ncbi:FAD dependent oxidoreductase [Gloeophyllum trabeum ATCC 11539]|uniref:FAD dependent oxidoreductase n=1 Tax=Gloeophyllum trabeum (strain ATCC 11539 / FP-39264 / Madison 617) TaxID=670483 RepID=S7Q6T0_GLOTA|nr:FAD dependent oxidoreductase [Gloeophyllum trabeum ATCC 11539]EPQ55237.1 FAD dependent oxidoreductase [Gloeophyllum trabeum ATCC 11539]
MASNDLSQKILIVGAGCFGISTAYHLLKRGYSSITVLDRSATLPAPDAASTDINRMVRSSYSDPFYSKLCHEAIESWRDQSEWPDVYRESGVLMGGAGYDPYTEAAYRTDLAMGARVRDLPDRAAIQAVLPPGVRTGLFRGYISRDGGWVDAAKATTTMTSKVIRMGGQVHAGKSVCSLVRNGGKTHGIECADGTVFLADLVIIATGSWTASNFPDLRLEEKCVAAGQSVVTIQLTAEESERYHGCPCMVNYKTGFYIFPPNKDNILKMGKHCGGHVNPVHISEGHRTISVPRTASSHGDDGLRIPKSMLQEIRALLAMTFPELAHRAFASTRLCWYTDTPDEDWIIGFYPGDEGLVIATGGSGHAYKFLPVIGRLTADLISGTLEPPLRKKFAVDRAFVPHEKTRSPSVMEVLDVSVLCSADDLVANRAFLASRPSRL